MVHINPQVSPTHPDGWHFLEDGVCLRGSSYKDLLVKVTEYRASNRKSWQTVQQEVNDYIASISPTSILQGVTSHQVPVVTMSDKVYNWLSKTYGMLNLAPNYSSAADALRRAQICAGCPKNLKVNSSCGLCVSTMKKLAQGIGKGRKTSLDKRINGCDVHGYDLKVAVHLEDDLLGGKVDLPGMPYHCWRRP